MGSSRGFSYILSLSAFVACIWHHLINFMHILELSC